LAGIGVEATVADGAWEVEALGGPLVEGFKAGDDARDVRANASVVRLHPDPIRGRLVAECFRGQAADNRNLAQENRARGIQDAAGTVNVAHRVFDGHELL